MNLNPDKVKKLVLSFSELDEEYQDKLLIEAYKLELMQHQKEKIKKEKRVYKSDKEFEQAITKGASMVAEESMKFFELFEQADDTLKAAMFMLIQQMAGKGNMIKESDITITVNQKELSIYDYLDQYFVNIDYDKAKEIVKDFNNKNIELI